jgi:quercetin dioxygenase-like cupin family protein
VLLLAQGQGEVVLDPRFTGFGVITKVPGSATGGRYCVVEHPLAPLALGSPRHTHRHEDETSYVISGEIMVEVDGQVVTVAAGGLVHKPRGLAHAFWNPHPEPALVLEVIAPARFEGYFADTAELLRSGGPLDPARRAAIADKYELLMEPASVQELALRYHLNVGGPPK